LSWNEHIDSVAKKLCSASYVIRNLKHTVSPITLKTLYYAYIHSIISHGIIFWGRASKVTKLFTLQKRIVRIMTDKKPRDSCRDAFGNMKILTLFSQYLFSLIVFTVENDYHFNLNKDIHKYNTRQNTNIHLPTVNLTKYQKGPYVAGGRAFNHLPSKLKNLVNDLKAFKFALKQFLYHHSFYSIEEYYNRDVNS